MTRHSRAAACTAFACLALASACATTMRKAPDYAQRMRSVHKIGLMPPETTAVRIQFTGDNESLRDVADNARTYLVEALTREVREHDYLVDQVVVEAPPEAPAAETPPPSPAAPASQASPAPDASASSAPPPAEQATLPSVGSAPLVPATLEPTPTETSDDAEVRFAATQAQKAVDQAFGEMYSSREMSKSRALRYKRSLGPDVNRLADRVDADALLFSRYVYVTKSKGEVTKDVAFTVLVAAATLGNVIIVRPRTASQLEICLVDGATGDVLFANTAGATEFFGEAEIGILSRTVLDGFKPTP